VMAQVLEERCKSSRFSEAPHPGRTTLIKLIKLSSSSKNCYVWHPLSTIA
jgi:hypothetical protein